MLVCHTLHTFPACRFCFLLIFGTDGISSLRLTEPCWTAARCSSDLFASSRPPTADFGQLSRMVVRIAMLWLENVLMKSRCSTGLSRTTSARHRSDTSLSMRTVLGHRFGRSHLLQTTPGLKVVNLDGATAAPMVCEICRGFPFRRPIALTRIWHCGTQLDSALAMV